jgi:hypothetical protein
MVRWFGVFAIEVDSSRCYNPSKSRRRRLIVLSSIEESRGQHRRARDNEHEPSSQAHIQMLSSSEIGTFRAARIPARRRRMQAGVVARPGASNSPSARALDLRGLHLAAHNHDGIGPQGREIGTFRVHRDPHWFQAVAVAVPRLELLLLIRCKVAGIPSKVTRKNE